MWRRVGGRLLIGLTVAVFVAEVAGVTAAVRWGLGLQARLALVGPATVGAFALLVVTASVLAATTASTARRRRYRIAYRRWALSWVDVVFDDASPPPAPLPEVALDALLDLRESVSGEAAVRVARLLSSYGVETGLIDRVSEQRGPLRRHLRRRAAALDERMDALDALARARTSAAMPVLAENAHDPDPAVRTMAIRALARGASGVHGAPTRREVVRQVVTALEEADLPESTLVEAIELMEDAAPDAVETILREPRHHSPRMVVAALLAIGRLGLSELLHHVLPYTTHRRIHMRAAAFMAIAGVGHVPEAAAGAVRDAWRDRYEVVRLEAARAARFLEPEMAVEALVPMLTDAAWRVRRVAASSLVTVGETGKRALRAVAADEHDEDARRIARQALMEAG